MKNIIDDINDSDLIGRNSRPNKISATKLQKMHTNFLKKIQWMTDEDLAELQSLAMDNKKYIDGVHLEYPQSWAQIFPNIPNIVMNCTTKIENFGDVTNKLKSDFGCFLKNSCINFGNMEFEYISLKKMCIFTLILKYSGDEEPKLCVDIEFAPLERNKNFVFDFVKYLPEMPTSNLNNFKIICTSSRGPYTETMRIAPKPIKDGRYDILYGEDFPLEEIRDFFTKETLSNEGGLMLLHGDAGSGKTNFIKQMIIESDKEVIYIPSSMTSILTDPSFTGFLMKQKDCIFVIEDAEEILSVRNQGTQNILEMTDGLLKDSLNIRVICTFNVEDSNIDSALKRKGRLYKSHFFDKLTPEEGVKVCELYDIDYTPTEDMTVAEIFNHSIVTGEDDDKDVAIGFAGMINR